MKLFSIVYWHRILLDKSKNLSENCTMLCPKCAFLVLVYFQVDLFYTDECLLCAAFA